MSRIPGWNDLDPNDTQDEAETREETTQQIQQAAEEAQEKLRQATKELAERVGMQGSLGRVSVGGARLSRGAGFTAGVQKSMIEPDGDVWIGADITQPSGVSLAVFVNAQDWNAEQMEEGDILIGDNSEGIGNIKYDASEGQFQFRNGTTVTVYMDTDGSVAFGSGTGWLNEDGIQLLAEGLLVNNNGYKFVDADGENAGGIYATVDGSDNTHIRLRAHGQNGGATQTASVDAVASNTALAQLTADSGLNAGGAATLIVRQTATGTVIFQDIDTVDLQAAVTVNDDMLDLDFIVRSDTNANAIHMDGATGFLGIGTTPASQLDVDGGATFNKSANNKNFTVYGDSSVVFSIVAANERVEIGSDHYFPTRNAANKTGYWNEANQDMDFVFEGDTNEFLLYIDAGLDKATSFAWDGWAYMEHHTWTRTGNHTFTVSGDVTTTYRKGTKVRYKDGGSYEYGVIGAVSHAAGTTTVTLITNSDYAMAAATITDNYISHLENPEGFPAWFNTASPTVTASGSMTWSTTSTIHSAWRPNGKDLEYSVFLIGTTGGTASTHVYIAPIIAVVSPFTAAKLGVTQIRDATSGSTRVGSGFIATTNGIEVYKADVSNWGLGTNRIVFWNGIYPY